MQNRVNRAEIICYVFICELLNSLAQICTLSLLSSTQITASRVKECESAVGKEGINVLERLEPNLRPDNVLRFPQS